MNDPFIVVKQILGRLFCAFVDSFLAKGATGEPGKPRTRQGASSIQPPVFIFWDPNPHHPVAKEGVDFSSSSSSYYNYHYFKIIIF